MFDVDSILNLDDSYPVATKQEEQHMHQEEKPKQQHQLYNMLNHISFQFTSIEPLCFPLNSLYFYEQIARLPSWNIQTTTNFLGLCDGFEQDEQMEPKQKPAVKKEPENYREQHPENKKPVENVQKPHSIKLQQIRKRKIKTENEYKVRTVRKSKKVICNSNNNICAHCYTTNTPLWRRFDSQIVCNACGLIAKRKSKFI